MYELQFGSGYVSLWELDTDNTTRKLEVSKVPLKESTQVVPVYGRQEIHLINLGDNVDDLVIAYPKIQTVSDLDDIPISIANYAEMLNFVKRVRDLQSYGIERPWTFQTFTPAASPIVELALPEIGYGGWSVDLATLAGNLTIQGIDTTLANDKKSLLLKNASTTHSITLSDNDASQTDATKRLSIAESNNVLVPQATVLLNYNDTLQRWVVAGGSIS